MVYAQTTWCHMRVRMMMMIHCGADNIDDGDGDCDFCDCDVGLCTNHLLLPAHGDRDRAAEYVILLQRCFPLIMEHSVLCSIIHKCHIHIQQKSFKVYLLLILVSDVSSSGIYHNVECICAPPKWGCIGKSIPHPH